LCDLSFELFSALAPLIDFQAELRVLGNGLSLQCVGGPYFIEELVTL
jgi:hypothetical protein